MKVTLDTNVLVRLATQDDAAQAAVALRVLKKATLIAVPTPALCEMVWVLLRGYRYTPAQVAHACVPCCKCSTWCATPPPCWRVWPCWKLGATLPTV